jgi:AmiR/NasT family two-component response regulator
MSPRHLQASERNLLILIADEDRSELARLGAVLEELGHEVTPYAVSVKEASELIVKEDPDLAFVMVHEDEEHALALIGEAVESASGPVIATVRKGDVEFVARAAEHGVSALVESTEPSSIQGAIEVALKRHREAMALSDKVDQLEGALERRAVIERAKGILMERHSVDDRGAFEILREHARSSNRRVVDVALAVTEGHALLPKSGGG